MHNLIFTFLGQYCKCSCMVCKDERLKYQLSTAPAHPRSYLGPGAGGRLPPPGAGMVNNIDPMLAGVTNQLKDTTIGGGIPPGAGLPPGGLPPGLGGPLGLGGGMVGVPDGVGGLVPGGDSGRNRFLASRRFVGVIKRCLHDCCMPASFAVLTCASKLIRAPLSTRSTAQIFKIPKKLSQFGIGTHSAPKPPSIRHIRRGLNSRQFPNCRITGDKARPADHNVNQSLSDECEKAIKM